MKALHINSDFTMFGFLLQMGLVVWGVVNIHPGIYKIINTCKYFFPPTIRKKSILFDLENRSPTKSEYGNGL